ncbi:hypothetical protein G4O51_01245 [Candidatus Bathyarchaeota archaeon A05DMB-2]|jgi:N-acetylneuraminic acid mutarotase|nr:hypothetical protein [Candidatus Bathyarchaeota archaeon A05DMB-2]
MKNKTFAIIIMLALLFPVVAPLTLSAHAAENSWTTKAPMHVARSGLGVAAVNGKIYAIGGSTDSGFAPSIPPYVAYSEASIRGFVGTNEEYNPATDTWTYKTSMPTPRMSFAIAVVQSKIYCIGGRTDAAGSVDGYTVINEVYNPETDNWETKAPLPASASWIVASVLENRIYVMDYSGTTYVYDTATDTWTTKAPVPAQRSMVMHQQSSTTRYSR